MNAWCAERLGVRMDANSPGCAVVWPGEEEAGERPRHTHSSSSIPACPGSKNWPAAVTESQISREQGRVVNSGFGAALQGPRFSSEAWVKTTSCPPKRTHLFPDQRSFPELCRPLLHPDRLLGCDPNISLFLLLVHRTRRRS